ncbi:hypothetical protein ES703_105588 [subsurface metagenome]
MAQFIDWKALLEGFPEATEEEKERIKTLLLDMPPRLLEELFEKELHARLLYEQAVGPWTPPIEWTKKLERKLRDTFEVTFLSAGISPRKFMPYYRLELDVIKTLTTENDMIKAVEEFAKELIVTEKARIPLIKPPRERPPRPPRIISPPEEEEEEVYIGVPIIPAEFPKYPRKGFIPSRRLTALERD